MNASALEGLRRAPPPDEDPETAFIVDAEGEEQEVELVVREPGGIGDQGLEELEEVEDVDEGEEPDELMSFFRSIAPSGRDQQVDAALLFAYYLQRREGFDSLQLGDLIRCCIRAGVDTRNFNRTLGTLTRRGFLETVRHGHAYRLSDQGVAAVETRM